MAVVTLHPERSYAPCAATVKPARNRSDHTVAVPVVRAREIAMDSALLRAPHVARPLL
jgi:hypothetical protein